MFNTEIEKVRSRNQKCCRIHLPSQMKMKAVARHTASFINSFKGTFVASSFKNPFLATRIQTIVAPFHSDSTSNHRLPSVFDKITKLDDALKLFDQMTQRKPLSSVVKFNQLLQAITKMKHYSCSIDLPTKCCHLQLFDSWPL